MPTMIQDPNGNVVPAATFRELRKFMDYDYCKNNKIESIKFFRSLTREGLRETKDFLEEFWIPRLKGLSSVNPENKEPTFHEMYPEFDPIQVVQAIKEMRNELDSLKAGQRKTRASSILQNILEEE